VMKTASLHLGFVKSNLPGLLDGWCFWSPKVGGWE
jgi:hypothetical protein